MKYTKLFIISIALAVLAACGGPAAENSNRTNVTTGNSNQVAAPQNVALVDRPQSIKDKMAARGEQDQAKPTLKILEPKAKATLTSSTVKVNLELGGDLKGYKPGMDHETKTGNHIHVILDNQPYEAFYEITQGPFELRNVSDGVHTLRVFPSRPWHESYKNQGAFQVVEFTVKNGGADPSKPATTNTGQPMSNTNSNASAAPTPEGKAMQPGNGGPVDATRPLLTYSRPKGEYKGADADSIMIDFWLSGASLKGDGGVYRVRYSVDGGTPGYIDKWEPIWLSGWGPGKHVIKLDLIDPDGGVVENAGFNSTAREITVVK
jgi:hypothetical protein